MDGCWSFWDTEAIVACSEWTQRTKVQKRCGFVFIFCLGFKSLFLFSSFIILARQQLLLGLLGGRGEMHEGWDFFWRSTCWHTVSHIWRPSALVPSTESSHVSSINTHSGSLTQPSSTSVAPLKREFLVTWKTMTTIILILKIKYSSCYKPMILFDWVCN